MHCWKILNIKKDYRRTRLLILSTIIFVLVFSFSFVLIGANRPFIYEDRYFSLFVIFFILLYPLHKMVHYFSLFSYRKSVKLKWKLEYKFVPIIHLRIKELIPKNRYMLTLITPFILVNTILILLAAKFPFYSHYLCLLLGYHCSMCLVDLLFLKHLVRAPKQAIIEETPKGYEILVPPSISKKYNN